MSKGRYISTNDGRRRLVEMVFRRREAVQTPLNSGPIYTRHSRADDTSTRENVSNAMSSQALARFLFHRATSRCPPGSGIFWPSGLLNSEVCIFTDSLNAATPFLTSTVQITVVRSNGRSHHSRSSYNLKVSVRLAVHGS